MAEAKATPQDLSAGGGKQNPANVPARRVTEATRVPMNLPEPKLAVPEMPGFYLYWHLGKNVKRALKAGYTFVDEEEVEVNQTGYANDSALPGHNGMGTRLSVISGVAENGRDSEELFLMKLPIEWHEADMAAQTARNEEVAVALRSGNAPGPNGQMNVDPDANLKFMKDGQKLFYPKGRRA